MAVDTTITAQEGAPALGPKLQVYQRTINFKTVALGGTGNLAADAWYNIFTTEAGDVVLAASMVVETLDSGGGTLQLGLGGGATFQQATALSAAATVCSTVTTPIKCDAGPITLCAKSAAVTTAKVHVTAVVLKGGDFAG